MSTQLKLRRGTTAQHSTFTGAEGEITVDTTKDTVVVHDGTTAGGIPLAKESALSGYVSTSGGAISANTSTDALRITQTGTGNALLVEDSANPDATPFVVSNQGAVGIGDPTPNATLGGTGISLKSADAYLPQIQMQNTTANNNGTFLLFKKDRSGAIVQNDDTLSTMSWQGYDGASYLATAAIVAQVDGTPGTNDMPGRLVFSTTADGASSPTERMRIDNAGRVGIGGTAGSGTSVLLARNITGATNANGFLQNATVQSDVTGTAILYGSGAFTAASSFTLSQLRHYSAQQGTFGSGSAVTSQFGYIVEGTTGATNNYGFYGNIASGTGRYNFYAAGTADNYFAGKLGVARTNPSVELEVGDGAGTRRISIDGGTSGTGAGSALYFKNGGTVYGGIGNPSALDGSAYSNLITLTSYYGLTFNTLGTERMRIDSSGNVIQSAPTTAPTLSTNGTMVFNLTSDTNLRVSVRGSDGVTRTANITLA